MKHYDGQTTDRKAGDTDALTNAILRVSPNPLTNLINQPHLHLPRGPHIDRRAALELLSNACCSD